MALPSPEQSTRWYQALLPIMERGGPVLTLALAVLLGAAVWYLLGSLEGSRQTSLRLYQQVLDCKDQQIAYLRSQQHAP